MKNDIIIIPTDPDLTEGIFRKLEIKISAIEIIPRWPRGHDTDDLCIDFINSRGKYSKAGCLVIPRETLLELAKRVLVSAEQHKVTVEVLGGVATFTNETPDWLELEIVDWDDLKEEAEMEFLDRL